MIHNTFPRTKRPIPEMSSWSGFGFNEKERIIKDRDFCAKRARIRAVRCQASRGVFRSEVITSELFRNLFWTLGIISLRCWNNMLCKKKTCFQIKRIFEIFQDIIIYITILYCWLNDCEFPFGIWKKNFNELFFTVIFLFGPRHDRKICTTSAQSGQPHRAMFVNRY